jgi:hypothetical protein
MLLSGLAISYPCKSWESSIFNWTDRQTTDSQTDRTKHSTPLGGNNDKDAKVQRKLPGYVLRPKKLPGYVLRPHRQYRNHTGKPLLNDTPDTFLYWTLYYVPKVSTMEGFHCMHTKICQEVITANLSKATRTRCLIPKTTSETCYLYPQEHGKSSDWGGKSPVTGSWLQLVHVNTLLGNLRSHQK